VIQIALLNRPTLLLPEMTAPKNNCMDSKNNTKPITTVVLWLLTQFEQAMICHCSIALYHCVRYIPAMLTAHYSHTKSQHRIILYLSLVII